MLKYNEMEEGKNSYFRGYITYISTHCEHITLEEPYKSAFYAGIKKAIMENDDKIVIIDTIPLYLVQKLQ